MNPRDKYNTYVEYVMKVVDILRTQLGYRPVEIRDPLGSERLLLSTERPWADVEPDFRKTIGDVDMADIELERVWEPDVIATPERVTMRVVFDVGDIDEVISDWTYHKDKMDVVDTAIQMARFG